MAGQKVSELDKEFLNAFRGGFDVTLLRTRGFKREEIDEETKKLMLMVGDRAASLSKALIELHTVLDDLRIALKMIGRYPWHGTEISKLKHFELTWFLFQNLCYKYREKLKLYHNCQKALALNLAYDPPGWLKAELKLVEKALGPAIRDRGNTVHGWDVRQSSIDWFGTVHLFNSIKEQGEELELPEGFLDVAGHYRDAKWELKSEARKLIADAEQILLRLLTFHAPLPSMLLKKSTELLNAVESGHGLVSAPSAK